MSVIVGVGHSLWCSESPKAVRYISSLLHGAPTQGAQKVSVLSLPFCLVPFERYNPPPPALPEPPASLVAESSPGPSQTEEKAGPLTREASWLLARVWPRVTGLCLPEKRRRLIPGICRESQDRVNHSSLGRDGCAVVLVGASECRLQCPLIPGQTCQIGFQGRVSLSYLTP